VRLRVGASDLLESVQCLAEWEISVFSYDSTALLDQSAGEVVKGTSEIVNDVSDNRSPMDRNSMRRLGIKQALSCMRIGLMRDAVWILSKQGGDIQSKLVKVTLCPLQLNSGTGKWIIHEVGRGSEDGGAVLTRGKLAPNL
jgi:hypothetical protein